MACPLFIPTTPLGELVSVAPPLGDLFEGRCQGAPEVTIDTGTLRRYCNFGYARGCCERASGSEADAVRLLVRGEHGGLVEVAWAVERDHHPVRVGVFEVETGGGCAPGTDVIAMQALACAQAYVRLARGD